MSNGSYCRFHNTYRDLMDCYDALLEMDNPDYDGLSEDEMKSYRGMLEVCRDIIEWSDVNEPKKYEVMNNG